MSEAIVKLGDGNWATKENNLLAHKQVGDRYLNTEFTVTRGTDATHVGRDGLIKQMSNLSPELVTNGNFSDTSAEMNTLPSQSGGVGNHYRFEPYPTNTTAYDGSGVTTITYGNDPQGGYHYFNDDYNFAPSLATVEGKSYLATITCKVNSGTFNIYLSRGTSIGGLFVASGVSNTDYVTYSAYFVAGVANSSWIRCEGLSTGQVVSINDVSIKELGQDWTSQTPATAIMEFGDFKGRENVMKVSITSNADAINKIITTVPMTNAHTVRFEAVVWVESGSFRSDAANSDIEGLSGGDVISPFSTTGEWTTLVGYGTSEATETDMPIWLRSTAEAVYYVDSFSVKNIEAVDDTPRIDFTGNPQGHLLLEPQRSNLIPYSNKLSTMTTAVKDGGTATTTTNYAVSPDGTYNAQRLQASAPAYDGSTTTWGLKGFSTTNGSNGDAYSSSVYLKSNTGANQNVAFYGSNYGTGYATVTSEWQRFEITGTRGSSNFYSYLGVRPDQGSDLTCDILVYGWQVEAGSDATSYIPTNGTTVTRGAETCTGAGAAKDFNDSEGVLYVEMAVEGWASGKYQTVRLFNTGDTNNNIQIRFAGNSVNSVQYIMYTDRESSNMYSYLHGQSGVDTGVFHTYALRYSSTVTTAFYDGSKVDEETSPAGGQAAWSGDASFTNPLPVGPINSLKIDANTNGPGFKIKAIHVYKEALSDADIIALTS